MLKRILSSIIGLPILIFIVAKGGLLLHGSLLLVSLIGLREFNLALHKKTTLPHIVSYLFTGIYFLVMPVMNETLLLSLLAGYLLSLLLLMVFLHEKLHVVDIATTFFGSIYVPVLMSFIGLVRMHPYGHAFVWLIFICAWGSDTFAYFTGKTLGKHKLCPKLSPNKTIEGSIGGVVGATVLGVTYGYFVPMIYPTIDIQVMLYFGIVTAVGAVFSQFGDLAASSMKRHTGIKDFGNLIPGHGGILDRFDSLLFTAPGVYIVMNILLGQL